VKTVGRRRRVIVGISVGVIVVAGAVAFGANYKSEFISLPPSTKPAGACPITPPNRPIPVEQLAQSRWLRCDPVGHYALFPDGEKVEISSYGGSTGLDQGPGQPRYFVENLGKWGVIAVLKDGDDKQYWGAARGVEAVKNRRSGT